MNAIQDQVNKLVADARALALDTCMKPKSERDYLIACGKVQQMIADARGLKERFLVPEEQADADLDPLPDERRRAEPQPDRLSAQRARHRPRQM